MVGKEHHYIQKIRNAVSVSDFQHGAICEYLGDSSLEQTR